MQIYEGQTIQGCCGQITTEYFIFNARPKNGGQPESIVVGSDCGRQFLTLLDERLPPMFNAIKRQSGSDSDSSSNSESSEGVSSQSKTQLFELDRYVNELTPLNLEFYNAIHLIVSCWDGVCSGVLSDMLTYLRKNPERDTSVRWLKVLNKVIYKDRRKRGLHGMAASLRANNPGMKFFKFPLITEALSAEGVTLKV